MSIASVNTSPPPGKHVAGVLLALLAALLARAWLQMTLQDSGYQSTFAADLSYFVVPFLLLVLLLPILRKDRGIVRAWLRFDGVSLRLVFTAIVIGLLVRVAWWAQLVTRIAFGWQTSSDPEAITGPFANFGCPPTPYLVAGIVVTAILIPPIEEVIHRGYVQTLFHGRGPLVAIAISTLLFTIFHRYSGWHFAFVGGAILGAMYWVSGSLWPSIVTHAVVNLLPQFTWRCLNLQWNPRPESLPLWPVGLTAALVFCLSTALIVWLVLAKCRRRDR